MFADALALLKKNNRGKKQDSKTGFRAYPRLPEYSKIDWTTSARKIHNLIRASTKPYSGAYTYLKINGEIRKLLIWESEIITEKTNDIGIPGHVIFNNTATGESHIYTGKGIIALKRVQFDGDEEFRPGCEWKSIRMRFGIDIEQELIELNKLLKSK
jgi:methionyl-tRNA formyltransferase